MFMTNQPLTSGDQFKIVFFVLLLLPAVGFVVGIIPAIFLIFGLFMMKKNESFSHIETAVRVFNGYTSLALIICLLITTYNTNNYLTYIPDPNSSYSYKDSYFEYVILSLLATAVPITYLILISQLFYKPLRKHQEWVAANGIFSSKPKEVKKIADRSELDIIKGEKFKTYSVADELLKWTKLKEEGQVSEQEFNDAKNKLLARG